jgi:hypothetical protein
MSSRNAMSAIDAVGISSLTLLCFLSSAIATCL